MSDNNTKNKPEETKAPDMKLDVSVRPIAPKENLLGFANVTIADSFIVEGIKICTGEKGLYINMPSVQDSRGNWRDVCKPITTDFHKQLLDAVIEGYGIAIEKTKAILEAATAAREKPSVTNALKAGTEKATAEPAKPAAAKTVPAR